MDLDFGTDSPNVATPVVGDNITSLNGSPNDGATDLSKPENKRTVVNNDEPADNVAPNADTKLDDTVNVDKVDSNTLTGDQQSVELSAGDVVEYDDKQYKVDAIGNLVDSNGDIFKEAKDVADFIKSSGVDDTAADAAPISIEDIVKKVGIEIVGEDNKPVTFDNTPEGISSYVNSVIELRENNIKESTINKLFEDAPYIKDVISYVAVKGNLDGFGQTPDRSSVELSKDDKSQQESIIRTAFKEFNKGGDVDSYIKYLTDSGTLYDVANAELNALKTKDSDYKKELEATAAANAESDRAELESYWNQVKQTIDTKVIGGYKIPDTIVLNRDGKRVTATPNDFFNYIYKADKEGKTEYSKAVESKDKEARMSKELITAFIEFTGGDYTSLVNMAINEKEVKTLKLKASTNLNKSKTVKVQKQGTIANVQLT